MNIQIDISCLIIALIRNANEASISLDNIIIN